MRNISTIIFLIILFLPLESFSQEVFVSPKIEKRDSTKYLVQKIAQKDTGFQEKRESINALLSHLNSEAIAETYGINGTLLNAMKIEEFLKRLKYGEYGEPDNFEISVMSDKEVTLQFVPVRETEEIVAVKVEIEMPESPTVEVELESPEVEIEIEIPKKSPSRKDRRRNKRIEVAEVTVNEIDKPNRPFKLDINLSEIPGGTIVEQSEIPEVVSEISKKPPGKVEEESQFILTSIPYKDNTFRFTKEFYDEIDRLAETMRKFPNLSITIESYFSDSARPKIVDQRAYYIQNYLVNKGIELNRIRINFSNTPINANSISIIGFSTTTYQDILNFYHLLKTN